MVLYHFNIPKFPPCLASSLQIGISGLISLLKPKADQQDILAVLQAPLLRRRSGAVQPSCRCAVGCQLLYRLIVRCGRFLYFVDYLFHQESLCKRQRKATRRERGFLRTLRLLVVISVSSVEIVMGELSLPLLMYLCRSSAASCTGAVQSRSGETFSVRALDEHGQSQQGPSS